MRWPPPTAVLLAAVTAAWAQEPPRQDALPDDSSAASQPPALYSPEETIALVSRREEPLRTAPAIATTLTALELRRLGARTVYDVLDHLPGLSVSRDVQGFFRAAVRGLRSDPEVVFLLNGHRLDHLWDGKALANLPIENLERVEIVRGPGSLLHGSGALLAVINLVTRKQGVRAALAGGSFEAFSGHALGATRLGNWKVYGDADVLRQLGYRQDVQKDALDRETVAQGLRGAADPAGRTNDQRTLVNAGGGVAYEEDDWVARASVRFMNEGRGALVGMFDTVGADSRLSWQSVLAEAALTRRIEDAGALHAALLFDDHYTRRLFQVTPSGFRSGPGVDQLFPEGMLERTELGARSFRLRSIGDFDLAAQNHLTVGVTGELQEIYRYLYETNYSADDRFTGQLGRPQDAQGQPQRFPQEYAGGAATRRLSLGLYAQDRWVLSPEWTLSFGFRVDATQLPTVDASKTIDGATLTPSFSPSAALVYQPTPALALKLVYGRAFRAPTVQELAEPVPNSQYNQGRFRGNPELDPSIVDAVQLGGEWVQGLRAARLRLRAGAFFESFTNPIAAVDTSGNIIPLRNRQGIRVVGAEGEARMEASARALTWVNASWFRAEDVETPSKFRLLTDVPQARLNAGVSLPLGEWVNLDLVVRTGTERRNNSRSVLELLRRYRIPAYALVSAQLRTERLADRFELAVAGQNVFEQERSDDVPRPDRMPQLLPREGASFWASVRGFF